jgi:hypothetical protein
MEKGGCGKLQAGQHQDIHRSSPFRWLAVQRPGPDCQSPASGEFINIFLMNPK